MKDFFDRVFIAVVAIVLGSCGLPLSGLSGFVWRKTVLSFVCRDPLSTLIIILAWKFMAAVYKP